MHVDTSALVALLADEPDGERISSALLSARSVSVCASARLEAVMVLSSELDTAPEAASRLLDSVLARCRATVVPLDNAAVDLAVVAFSRFGKGRDSRARLNFGDCCVYAAAKQASQPLLFIGADFIHTDIVSVLDDPRPLRR
jgi:ribonuclease VapC